MNAIVNAAPMVQSLGVKDNSAAVQSPQPASTPDHMPHSFIWAQRGPLGRQLCDASNLVAMYGSDTFDERKKFATHQTALVNVVAAAGNAQIIERLVPADAGPKANFRLALEVIASEVPVYQRDANGLVMVDADGAPLPTDPATTTPGYRVRWVKTTIATGGPSTADSTTFGNGTTTAGTLTDNLSAGSSQIYPIFDFWAGSYGADGNNEGLRLMAPMSSDDSPPNTSVMDTLSAFIYRLQAIRRVNGNSTPSVKNTLAGETMVEFVLKADQIDPRTNALISLGDVFKDSYQSLGNPLRADVYAGIPNVHIYTANLETLQALLFAAEKTAMGTLTDDDGSDFAATAASADAYKFNLFTFRSTSGSQYRGIEQVTTGTDVVTLGASTNLYCASGSDGTIDDATFNTSVAAKMDDYADANSDALDTATNPVSIIYDSGFALDTKYALCNIMARRKDTAVILSTYTDGVEMTASQEASVGISLRARLALYPESTYFGTPVVRGMVIARYGKLITSNFPRKLPLTLWLAGKAAAMMGAGDGIWNASKMFDSDPGNIVDNFKDLNATFVPAGQRTVDWANGLNYPIPYSRDKVFFAGLRTAFTDDTSVLTSFFTMMGCIALQKVGEQVWREYTGNVKLTRAQLLANVNQSVVDKTQGKFAGLFKIVPKAFISGGDDKRGYSWTLPIELYANNATTVMTLSVEAYRMPAA